MPMRISTCPQTGLALLMTLQLAAPMRAQQPNTNQQAIQHYYIAPSSEPQIPRQQLIQLLREKVKYVFVFYQENRSFDSYFGTYPGAEGLFTSPASQTPGFVQPITNVDGTQSEISPFRIGPKEYAADTDDVDHSHALMVGKMHLEGRVPQMNRYAEVEEGKYTTAGSSPTLKAKQYGELTMAYEDCDTVPLLWRYANRFTLFDHMFQNFTGPSTPGNIAIIAGQTGQTQWALHPDEAYMGNGNAGQGVPVSNDSDPFWGSQLDTTPPSEKLPANPPSATPQMNLTFASLPLTLMGGELSGATMSDRDPDTDLADVADDVKFISNLNLPSVPFGWYQEGFDLESTDATSGPVTANGSHASYITHHDGPQYFGYVANNPNMTRNLHGLGDFFHAVEQHQLPAKGGVFWVKGGFTNIFNLRPGNPDPTVQKNFLGDDDHPAYSDAQISEALVAEGINRIAASPYWAESAIVITYDDSEGDYDHVRPPVRTIGPDGSVTTDGPRVPLIVISPFSKTNYISKQYGTQVSAIRLINTIFNLPPLATLPDERLGFILGERRLGQTGLGPEDGPASGLSDLLDAFSPSRLSGNAAPLPASYAEIPESLVLTLPTTTGYGCSALGITPVDLAHGIVTKIPADFNPRPGTNPTAATQAVAANR